MEKASKCCRFGGVGWSDVRSWDALHDIGHKNANGLRVSVRGVNGLLIVASANEVMILPCGIDQKARDFATDQQFRSDMDGKAPLSSWLNPSTRPIDDALHLWAFGAVAVFECPVSPRFCALMLFADHAGCR